MPLAKALDTLGEVSIGQWVPRSFTSNQISARTLGNRLEAWRTFP